MLKLSKINKYVWDLMEAISKYHSKINQQCITQHCMLTVSSTFYLQIMISMVNYSRPNNGKENYVTVTAMLLLAGQAFWPAKNTTSAKFNNYFGCILNHTSNLANLDNGC